LRVLIADGRHKKGLGTMFAIILKARKGLGFVVAAGLLVTPFASPFAETCEYQIRIIRDTARRLSKDPRAARLEKLASESLKKLKPSTGTCDKSVSRIRRSSEMNEALKVKQMRTQLKKKGIIPD
jgi:hypothetical protein